MRDVSTVCEITINDKLNVMLISLDKQKRQLIGENIGIRVAPTPTPLISTRRQVEEKRAFNYRRN